MARVVETVACGFDNRLVVKKIVIRTPAGAERYRQIVRQLGKQVPVPSLIINGVLAFSITPGTEELDAHLKGLIVD